MTTVEELTKQLAQEKERADFAWRNARAIEAARVEEMRKRDEAEAALETLRRLWAWLPIETAPKDRSILVVGGTWSSDGGGSGMCDNDYPLTQPVIACWQRDGWCMGSGDAYNEEWWAIPTHWMPLPDPPSAV